MSDKLIAKLKKLAAGECWSDDPDLCIADYAGGNIDDAYYGGEHSGRTELAREILPEVGAEIEALKKERDRYKEALIKICDYWYATEAGDESAELMFHMAEDALDPDRSEK